MEVRIAQSDLPRVVIIGGGFGGVHLVNKLRKFDVQVVVIDQYNFHQFQPLFYQVATSGLEPSSIIFPFRKMFQKNEHVHFRLAEVEKINTLNKEVITSIGRISYDYLVIATGAGNNFFGNENIEKYALPMKSINESLRLRNIILERFEEALGYNEDERDPYLHFVIAGGGPTGTELAGTLAEMRSFVLPKDYPELDLSHMRITLIEGAPRVLAAMSEQSSKKAQEYLENLGVEIHLNTYVGDYDGEMITTRAGEKYYAHTLIWAAGIKANFVEGLPEDTRGPGNRIWVNEYNQVRNLEEVFAIGDVALMEGDPNYPKGHPQLAQAAIQQGNNLAKNIMSIVQRKPLMPFRYKNLGTMATVGRNKAVVELPHRKFAGFFAWLIWMLVHLRSILGIKNKWVVFMNWVWNYFTYNLSLRLIIKRKDE